MVRIDPARGSVRFKGTDKAVRFTFYPVYTDGVENQIDYLEVNGERFERVGYCENVAEPPVNGGFWPAPHFKCSECGHDHVSMDYVDRCPKCGAIVKDPF